MGYTWSFWEIWMRRPSCPAEPEDDLKRPVPIRTDHLMNKHVVNRLLNLYTNRNVVVVVEGWRGGITIYVFCGEEFPVTISWRTTSLSIGLEHISTATDGGHRPAEELIVTYTFLFGQGLTARWGGRPAFVYFGQDLNIDAMRGEYIRLIQVQFPRSFFTVTRRRWLIFTWFTIDVIFLSVRLCLFTPESSAICLKT